MVIPFGVSVGDFIAGLRLLHASIEAFSNVRGARPDYLELRKSLGSLLTALDSISSFNTPLHQAATAPIVTDCRALIIDFLVDAARFDSLRNDSVGAKKLRTGLRKLQWSLCKKKDVLSLKGHLDTHVGALQLLLLTFQVSTQAEMHKAIADITSEVSTLKVHSKATLQCGERARVDLRASSSLQTQSMSNLEEKLEAGSRAAAGVSAELSKLSQHLHRGLSAKEQRTMFRLLEECVADKKNLLTERNMLEQGLKDLAQQNEELKTHLIELKAAVQLQKEIPAQVMLRRPVVLIDAFEENRLPFHLEFINSFEALLAVLLVRFKDRGDDALDRIRGQLFDMYEVSSQRRIDVNGPWGRALQPGLFIEMSILVPANPEFALAQCPGCKLRRRCDKKEGEKISCPDCRMTHRWSRRFVAKIAQITLKNLRPTLDVQTNYNVSSYCNVETVASSSTSWYCCCCGEGPHSSSLMGSCVCGHVACSGCTEDAAYY